MKVASLSVEFYLSGCRSLKEKRMRLGGLRERFGRQTNVAVCESAHADSLQHATWSFVACGADAQIVQATLSRIEQDLAMRVDAQISHCDWRWW